MKNNNKQTKNGKISVHFNISIELENALHKYCTTNRLFKSSLIEKLISDFIEKAEKEDDKKL